MVSASLAPPALLMAPPVLQEGLPEVWGRQALAPPSALQVCTGLPLARTQQLSFALQYFRLVFMVFTASMKVKGPGIQTSGIFSSAAET